jgi:hypothetical protein
MDAAVETKETSSYWHGLTNVTIGIKEGSPPLRFLFPKGSSEIVVERDFLGFR